MHVAIHHPLTKQYFMAAGTYMSIVEWSKMCSRLGLVKSDRQIPVGQLPRLCQYQIDRAKRVPQTAEVRHWLTLFCTLQRTATQAIDRGFQHLMVRTYQEDGRMPAPQCLSSFLH